MPLCGAGRGPDLVRCVGFPVAHAGFRVADLGAWVSHDGG